MSYLPAQTGSVVDDGNSFNGPLAANTAWDGAWRNVSQFAVTNFSVGGSPGAALGVVSFQFSSAAAEDNSTITRTFALDGPNLIPQQLVNVLTYFRVRYVNGATPLANLSILTRLFYSDPGQLTRYLDQAPNDHDPIKIVKAIITGERDDGTTGNARISADDRLEVEAKTVSPIGTVIPSNSTTTPLGANGVFTGGVESTLNATRISLICVTDADGSLSVQWSSNGVNFVFTQDFSVQANFVRALSLDVRAEFFRVVYTNGPVPQGVFRLEVIGQASGNGPPTQIINAFLTENNVATNVRALVAAKDASVVTNPPFRNVTGVGLPGNVYAQHVSVAQPVDQGTPGANPWLVSQSSQPLPLGAATNAAQTDGSQKTQVTTLPLPPGAATSALQSAPPDYLISSSGFAAGVAAVYFNIIGRRSQGWLNTTALGDVADYLDTSQANINTPTSGQTLYLVSTNAADAAAGTGARTVRIVYLDGSGNQQVRTDTLNGTTPVSLGSGFTFIQWMEVATVGSGGVAAGNVTVSSTNGAATVATTFEQITAGGNRSLSCKYKVPTGKTAYLKSWAGGAVSAVMDMRIRADVFADNRALSAGVFHFVDNAYIGSGQLLPSVDLFYLKCPAGAVIKVSAIPASAPSGNRADASFTVLVTG